MSELEDYLSRLRNNLSKEKEPLNNKTVLSVSALTSKIKENLEINFSHISVEGELSNLSKPSSGHWYATLKDKNAQINIVIFKVVASKIRFEMKDGLEVELKGQLTVYSQRGNYQIIVNSITPRGIGSLQLAFEQLKAKLQKEGLFDVERKRTIPFLPQTIGLVTSLTGAAIKDFLTTVRMRCPIVNVILIPVKVQGDGSAFEIAAAIQKFNYLKNVDVIVIGRGGGSLEDLWAFNEEIVAWSIYHSEIPVVSAVGHEIDVSISDFVADVRALTPTHAGVLCVPDLSELEKQTLKLHQKFKQFMNNATKTRQVQLKQYQRLFTVENFEKRFQQNKMQCDSLEMRLKAALLAIYNEYIHRFSVIKVRFANVHLQYENRFKEQYKNMKIHAEKLNSFMQQEFKNKKNRLELTSRSLSLLSPLKILDRGYSITQQENKQLIKSIKNINKENKMITRFSDGIVTSVVEKIEELEGKIL